jgi:hypothetical protein
MRNRSRSMLLTGLAVLGLVHTAGCGDSISEPEDTGYPWAGVYEAATRAGDASAPWVAAEHLEITREGRVFVGGIEMQNINLGENTVIWTVRGGNPHSAAVALQDGSPANGIWGPGGAEGVLFQGWIEYPGEERRNYRGLRQ